MKKFTLLCALFLLLAVFGGCTAPETEDMTVWMIKGPTGIGAVHRMDKAGYDFRVAASQDEVVAKVLSGEYDIAALPTNLAAKLYARTGGAVTLLAVNTAGVLSVIERGDAVHSLADLAGKTMYSSGKGATPEYVFRYLLTAAGLDPDRDVDLSFVADNDALAAILASGETDLALVPQPTVSTLLMQNADLRVALDLTDVWDALGTDSRLLMGCVVVRTDYLSAHPDRVATFLDDYAASIAATEDVTATAALCERYGILPKAAVAARAIPDCHLCFLTGDEMKAALAPSLAVLHAADPQSVGGTLPDEEFYYVG